MDATAERSTSSLTWLAIALGLALLAVTAFLSVAPFTADSGRDCGSVLVSSEIVHSAPPHDRGCASALRTRRTLFGGAAVVGIALTVVGVSNVVQARSGSDRRTSVGSDVG